MEVEGWKARGGPTTSELLESVGIPGCDRYRLPTSTKRFPDGVAYRVEIPSVEGPSCLDAVLAEASRLEVPVTRVSQGSGVMMLTDRELDAMVSTAAAAGIEVSLFARPPASWGTSAAARAPAGGVFAASSHGQAQLVAGLDDVRRAADHGIRSVLVSDMGVLAAFGRLRLAGHLPEDMRAKVSVMLPIANAATAITLVDLGADTLNIQTDLTLPEIAAIREAIETPLDIYIEAPDNVGGFVRYHDIVELIRIAAPVYVKFGLRNAPDIYPSGSHLEATAVALSVARVHRARLGMEALARAGADLNTSAPNAAGLAVPRPGTDVGGPDTFTLRS